MSRSVAYVLGYRVEMPCAAHQYLPINISNDSHVPCIRTKMQRRLGLVRLAGTSTAVTTRGIKARVNRKLRKINVV